MIDFSSCTDVGTVYSALIADCQGSAENAGTETENVGPKRLKTWEFSTRICGTIETGSENKGHAAKSDYVV